MAVLIGQVYNPRFKEEKKEGEDKVSFMFSLATRKAFIEDTTKPNVFTQCVTYQKGLAELLKKHFGTEEDKGKSIVAYGHFNDYEWYPNPENSDHDKYFQEVTVPKDYMVQSGLILAEGSKQTLTVLVPIKQTTRQFVVTGFEFADSNTATKSSAPAKQGPQLKLAGTPANSSSTPVPVGDDATPF